jgi:4-hydroxybenzoate polyprenyltransferase
MLRAALTLARPRLLPFVLCLPLVGFGWAHWDHALNLREGEGVALLLVLGAWVALQTGTLWLNAALDRDRGEVLFGRAVPVPSGIVLAAVGALVVAILLACAAHPVAGGAALLCAVLAVLYSHPRIAWKGHPLGGPLVNGVGYGLLSSLAGWAVVGVSPTPRALVVWLLGGLGTLGCYFAAQAFQQEEDCARGYRTLVATHGPVGALAAARLCLGAGFLGGTLLATLGWLPRLCLAALPLGLWIDGWLRRWARQPAGGNEGWARGLALRLLAAALLGIGLAYLDYGIDLLGDGPVAGLATRRGHPPPGR